MSNLVETNLSDDYVSSKTSASQAQEQEVKDCTEFLKIEYRKYKKYAIILQVLEEWTEDDEVHEEELRQKVKSIILGERMSQIKLNDPPVDNTYEMVLGVSPTQVELTCSEGKRLQGCLKVKLNNKLQKLKHETISLLGNKSSALYRQDQSSLQLTQEDSLLLELRNTLTAEQKIYVKNELELLRLLEELANIRLKEVQEATQKKVDECCVKSKVNFLKSQLALEKCRVDIFMETDSSLKAYTDTISEIKEQKDKLRLEIQKLQDLKNKYAQVSCKEYDNILKSYLQYKSSLEKKKMMYELYG